jgi:hypothetical protein
MNERPITHVIDEETKARAAQAQTTAGAAEKVLAEFALQDYPDIFMSVIKACQTMPGVYPSDFACGYLLAVSLNLASVTPKAGTEPLVAKIYAKLLEEELLRHWGVSA